MAETMFVHGTSSAPVRNVTGTIARSGALGSASCFNRYVRNAPVHTAMMMSLTVPPLAFFNDFTTSSEVDAIAKRRWAVIVLFHGVGGAGVSGSRTRSTALGLSVSGRRVTERNVLRTKRVT